jgi:RNA polymerase sigma-70 factor (ECF subfamily)
MTPAVTQPVAPPADPVRAALDDAEVREGLRQHAQAVLGRWLSGRPLIVRDEAVAEAVQETQLRSLQKFQTYTPQTGSVRAWLHGILNIVLLETTRKLRGQPCQLPANKADCENLAAPDLPAEEVVLDRLAAEECLARLTAEQRELLRLRLIENLSHDEIAVRLGISPVNARVRLSRALTAARAIAGATPGEDRP